MKSYNENDDVSFDEEELEEAYTVAMIVFYGIGTAAMILAIALFPFFTFVLVLLVVVLCIGSILSGYWG